MKVSGAATRESLHLLSAGIVQAAALTLRAGMAAAEASEKATTQWKDRRPEDGTRSTIKTSSSNGLRGFVSVGGAARFLEWGTRPHVIRAKGGGTLRFEINGAVFFRKMVNHPGISPRLFVTEAREMAIRAIDSLAPAYVGHAIQRAH